jgi:C-methyltransferase
MALSVAQHPEQTESPAGAPMPHQTIWTLTNAIVPSACLHVVAELGVADRLGEEPARAEELASSCGADPSSLDRVLRLLACHGIFRREQGAYVHTPASRLLRSDHPESMRAFGQLMALRLIWLSFSNLEHSVLTGRPSIELVCPAGLFAHLRDHPDEAQIFARAMTAKSLAEIPELLAAYDFARFDRIADIGGARRHLLRALLDASPSSRGVLFDLPVVIEGLEIDRDRLDTQAGDFFTDPLPAADCYLLSEVLQDWSDEQCLAILRAVRAAAKPYAKLLVIENVLSDLRTRAIREVTRSTSSSSPSRPGASAPRASSNCSSNRRGSHRPRCSRRQRRCGSSRPRLPDQQGEQRMHALIFQITISKQEEADRLLHEQFVPGMSKAPGFVGGYWVELPPNKGISMIVFESEEAVKAVMAARSRPQTDSFTIDSIGIGKVVAHA